MRSRERAQADRAPGNRSLLPFPVVAGSGHGDRRLAGVRGHRARPDSRQLAPERWRADVTSLPATTYARSPGTIAAALVAASILLALLAVWLVWRLARPQATRGRRGGRGGGDARERARARAAARPRGVARRRLARAAEGVRAGRARARLARARRPRRSGARARVELRGAAISSSWTSSSARRSRRPTGASRDRRPAQGRPADVRRARARRSHATDGRPPSRVRGRRRWRSSRWPCSPPDGSARARRATSPRAAAVCSCSTSRRASSRASTSGSSAC